MNRRLWLYIAAFAALLQALVAVGALVVAIQARHEAARRPTLEEVADKIASERARDEEEIRRLIADEAAAARAGDVDKAVSLYSRDAVVRDARGPSWSGLTEIRSRYSQLSRFKELNHVDVKVEVSISGEFGSAQASTTGVIVNEDGTNTPISSMLAEVWVFQKIDGVWKILSFTYNAQLQCSTTY